MVHRYFDDLIVPLSEKKSHKAVNPIERGQTLNELPVEGFQ
jgi:hypothetical protein